VYGGIRRQAGGHRDPPLQGIGCQTLPGAMHRCMNFVEIVRLGQKRTPLELIPEVLFFIMHRKAKIFLNIWLSVMHFKKATAI